MTKYVVAVYLRDRAYGGPEEGGWWFDCGELVRVMKVFGNEQQAIDYNKRLNRHLKATLNHGRRDIGSVLSDGVYCGEVWDDFAPKFYPEQRPHYE